MKLAPRIIWSLALLIAAGGFGIGLFLLGRFAVLEIQVFAQSLSEQDVWTLPIWLDGTAFQKMFITRVPPPGNLMEAISGDQGELVLPALFDLLKGVGGFVTGALVILFLSIYWSINQIHFERLWLSLLSSDMRKQARWIWRTIESDIGGYIRGQLMLSLAAGLLLGSGFWLLGSPSPSALALVGALLCLIPVVGSFLAIIPPLLVGFFSTAQHGFFMVLYSVFVMIAIMMWVKPRIFNRRWNNPILTLVIVIGLADAYGIAGIIISPPISAVCQILWNHLISHRVSAGAAYEISDLEKRLEKVRETVNSMEEPHLPLVTNSIERITNLITEARHIFDDAMDVKSSES
jgi:predicted PurR-regulated permease PerM